MREKYGADEQISKRLCVSVDSVHNLLVQIEKAGLQLVQCDFELPYRQTLTFTSTSDFSDSNIDIRKVARIFFTCDAPECHAQCVFVRDRHAGYAFHTYDQLQSYVLRGIFQTFINTTANDADPCLDLLQTKAQVRPMFEGKKTETTADQSSAFLSSSQPAVINASSVENSFPQPHKKANISKRWAIGGIIAAVASLAVILEVPSVLHQGDSAVSQSKVANDQLGLESRALFKTEDLPRDSPPSSVNPADHDYAQLNFTISNIGRSPATSIYPRCGEKNAHGPYVDLGTIAASGSRSLHLRISESKADLLHQRDTLCYNTIYLLYDDAAGHHVILFDSAGNAVPESSDKE